MCRGSVLHSWYRLVWHNYCSVNVYLWKVRMFKMVRWFWCLEVLELGLFVPPGLLSSLFYLVSVLVVGQVVGSSTCFLPPSCWAVLGNGKSQWEMRGERTLRLLPLRFSLQGHLDQMSYFFRQPLSVILSPLYSSCLPFPLYWYCVSPKGWYQIHRYKLQVSACSLWAPLCVPHLCKKTLNE